MNWTSVEDKLPKERGHYYVLRKWSSDINASGQEYFNGENFYNPIMDSVAGEITHWMPLPIPPA